MTPIQADRTAKRRRPRPANPDTRQPWQIEQGAACGCKGTDDMCPCQNENPWPRPRRDYEGEIRTLELQQQTDRQTIASLLARVEGARRDRAELTDIISEALSDSIDMDWSASIGARYVLDALAREGLVTLEPSDGN